MVSVLINWLYIAGNTFLLGCGLACLTKRITGYEIERVDSLIMMGLVAASVYAQFFSLITGVALSANIILLLLCVLIAILCREFISKQFRGFKVSSVIIVGILVVLWSYFTSRGYMHYDSDLYHAQSIEWIERFGVVKGLGNLHFRFAYNSSFFALSALYSFSFIKGISLHTLSGFFALLLSCTCMKIGNVFSRKKFVLSDFARIACIYYLFTITDEVVAPASDYSTMLVVFFIVIKYLDYLEKNKSEKPECTPFALLCVLGVYAMTLKLTAALVLVVLIYPAFLLIKQKRTKEIFFYLISGIVTAAPWMTRTVLISGWLIYPFPALDLFSFDWKIDKAMVVADSCDIKTWGRALYNGSLVDAPVKEWFPNWFETTLSGTEKILIVGAIAACAFSIIYGIVICIKKKWDKLPQYGVLMAVNCSYLFWQLSAPLIRYGYAYVLLADALLSGLLISKIFSGKKKSEIMQMGLFFCFIMYGCYKLFWVGMQVKNTAYQPFYIEQQPYDTYDMISYEVDGETFYYPDGGDRCGYSPFPASPEYNNFSLRGEGLKDGFR